MENDQKEFSVNFSIPEIINLKDLFSCKNELASEWEHILDRVFPESVDVEKEKFENISITDINCNGSYFEFIFEEQDLSEEDKKVLAYMMARTVQQEHDVPEKKIDIRIVTKNLDDENNILDINC